MLNPIIAFLAFYWLAQSIIIQRAELEATRNALQESAKSQDQHQKHASTTARISGMNILLESVNMDIRHIRSEIAYLSERMSAGGGIFYKGTHLSRGEASDLIRSMEPELEEKLKRRDYWVMSINDLVRSVDV